MIRLEVVTARSSAPGFSFWGKGRARGLRQLPPTTLALDAGAHVLLGAPDDGVRLVLDVISGRARARSGRVEVAGGSPNDPTIRRGIAHVSLEVALPNPFRVDETLAAAAHLRGEPARDPVARLETLGIASLATRNVRTLAPEEARAVAIAEAVTSHARVIVIEEPYVQVDPRVAARLADALLARAREGACVVIGTASLRDASDFAQDQLIFDRGILVRRTNTVVGLLAHSARGVRLRVALAGTSETANASARRLIAELEGNVAITSIEITGGTLVLDGEDLVTMASAVARASLRAGVTIDALCPDVVTLDELRASMSGDAAGAYRRAFDQARLRPFPPSSPPMPPTSPAPPAPSGPTGPPVPPEGSPT